MFVLRNPGLANQVVAEDDFRAKAGVPVDTAFNYLPNVEISNADGNFVPWTPTSVDIEALDWELEADAAKHMLVVDIKNGYYNYRDQFKQEVWGYQYRNVNDSSQAYFGTSTVIEEYIYLDTAYRVFRFLYAEATHANIGRVATIHFSLQFQKEHWGKIRDLLRNKGIKVTVGDEIFDLGVPTDATFVDSSPHIQYRYDYRDLNALPGLIAKMKETNVLTRYCFDWYDIPEQASPAQ
jgi:hypothetical protein